MSIENVCAKCFDDEDLCAFIRRQEGPRGCDACGENDAPTCKLSDVCQHIQSCLETYWGFAVEQLPYESAEGGYQGNTWDTYDLLVDECGLSLPRDQNDELLHALIQELGDDTWCDYDWLSLDLDVALRTSWEQFCNVVKHERRFFFHSQGADDRESFTPTSLLKAIADIAQDVELIRSIPAETRLWRARPDLLSRRRSNAADFGPPPPEQALQSNRMNPPGIPMFYLASTARTALAETRANIAMAGCWETTRSIRVLDLRQIPSVPGIFSGETRERRLGLRFLRHFGTDIMTPVERDQRVHVEYLPSQVVTEFVRDYSFTGGKIDGVLYGSTVHERGWNVALFFGAADLGLQPPELQYQREPSLRFVQSRRVSRR